MIKTILSLVMFLSLGAMVAQNLDLRDENDNSIDGLTHYIYDTGINLSSTKFHVANSSGDSILLNAEILIVANPTNTDWQVIFGTSYLADGTILTPQLFFGPGSSFFPPIAPASGSYNDFRIAPFSFSWVNGDWGVCKVKAINSTNTADSSGAYVVWTMGGSFTGDQNGNKVVDGSEIAGDIDGNGIIDGSEITGDMNGNGIIDIWETNGDANGNGIIDNGEVVSIGEFTKNNVVFDARPNPASNNLTITYSIDGDVNQGEIEIDVYDVLGQKINTYPIHNNKGQLKLKVDELNSGIYFYTINIKGERIRTKRVIVQ